MRINLLLLIAMWTGLAVACRENQNASGTSTNVSIRVPRAFPATGVVKKVNASMHSVVIKHEAISNYMKAMTMPFKVKNPAELSGLQPGDKIGFRLLVTEQESWIDQVLRTGQSLAAAPQPAASTTGAVQAVQNRSPLMDYKFTNELGQAVSLSAFRGQALALTFFFTRCPIPDFCPRLSKNFEEASQTLRAQSNAPSNYHFLSVSFDPEFDTPAVLKAYADKYHYDPAHWSFLTGAPAQLGELAQLSGATYEPEGPFFNHNFRTLIIDTVGRLQMSFPIGGNLSDVIAKEMLKAAAVTNR